MNALHDGRNYLIDRYSISMMPSASALKYLSRKKAGKGGGILIFGNPDLGDSKLDLAYAEQEAEMLPVSDRNPKYSSARRRQRQLYASIAATTVIYTSPPMASSIRSTHCNQRSC